MPPIIDLISSISEVIYWAFSQNQDLSWVGFVAFSFKKRKRTRVSHFDKMGFQLRCPLRPPLKRPSKQTMI
jgi:hypothetical protein